VVQFENTVFLAPAKKQIPFGQAQGSPWRDKTELRNDESSCFSNCTTAEKFEALQVHLRLNLCGYLLAKILPGISLLTAGEDDLFSLIRVHPLPPCFSRNQ
jgi:hypothetical protein